MSYNTTIRSTDPKAADMLKENLAHKEANNAYMQKINDYYKEHGTVAGCPDIPEETAAELDSRVTESQSTPYPGSFFKRNYEDIRRLEANIRRLEDKPETIFKGWEFNGGEAVINLANNRLQLRFEEKPTDEQRAAIKQQGFKWAPSSGSWQRPLDRKAFSAADKLDFIKPKDGKNPSDLQPKQPKREQPER